METGQSGVTDVAITAKTGFALWSKAAVTIELSAGCIGGRVGGANGLITGVVELKERQRRSISEPLQHPHSPSGNGHVYVTRTERERDVILGKYLLTVCVCVALIRFGTKASPFGTSFP